MTDMINIEKPIILPAEAKAFSIDIAPNLVILSVYFMTRNVIIEATKKKL